MTVSKADRASAARPKGMARDLHRMKAIHVHVYLNCGSS
jgi:hypothetical protein